MKRYDVVVIGAGPAGAFAAAELAGAGSSVLLVDRARFPRDKVCGCCLQPAALAVLREAGLEAPPGIALETLELVAGGAVARLPLPGGRAVSRRALDAALVAAAIARGAEFRDGTNAHARAGEVWLGGGERVAAGVVLDASGLGGGEADPRSLVGAGTIVSSDCRPGVVTMVCAAGGYVGTTRIEGGRASIAAALNPRLVRQRGIAGAVASILGRAPDGARWRGTPLLTRRARLSGDRRLAIGDAAGYIEPFTGEGIAWALRSARAAAALVAQGWRAQTAREWQETHGRLLRGRQRSCRAWARALRVPWLVRAGVGVLCHAPGLARPFVRAAAFWRAT